MLGVYLQGYTYTSGVTQLCCPTYTVHAEKAGFSPSETISPSSLTTASLGQLATGVPGVASLANSASNSTGQCNSSVTFEMVSQSQVRTSFRHVLCLHLSVLCSALM